MAGDRGAIDAHRATVRALAKPGQALALDGPHATVRNPEWFRYVGGRAIVRSGRAELHDRLIREVVESRPGVRFENRAIVLAGPPGAGKSTVLRDEILGDAASGWLTVDADDFKHALLRAAIDDGSYDAFLKPAVVREHEAAGERFFPLELASLVHEESSELAKRLRGEAIRAGANIVIDTVLSSEVSALGLGKQLEEAGYGVDVVDVEVPYELSESRIAKRWQQSYEVALESGEGLGGRWVPSEYARAVFGGPDGRSFPEFVAERLAVECGAVDHYRRFRTAAEGADRVLEVDKVRLTPRSKLVDASVAAVRARATDGLASPRRPAPRARDGRGRDDRGRE